MKIKLIDVQWESNVPEDKRASTLVIDCDEQPMVSFADELGWQLGDPLLHVLGAQYVEGVKSFKIPFEKGEAGGYYENKI